MTSPAAAIQGSGATQLGRRGEALFSCRHLGSPARQSHRRQAQSRPGWACPPSSSSSPPARALRPALRAQAPPSSSPARRAPAESAAPPPVPSSQQHTRIHVLPRHILLIVIHFCFSFRAYPLIFFVTYYRCVNPVKYLRNKFA